MKKFKIFIINLLLFTLAFILVQLFLLVGLITSLLSIVFLRASTNYFLDCALLLDKFGNVMCQHFFNYILLNKNSKYKFGLINETISSVLGKNKLNNTLSKSGIILSNILDFIDKDHCINAIRWN